MTPTLAETIHRGRRIMVWQTRIATEEGKLIALILQTQLVLRRAARFSTRYASLSTVFF